MYLPVSRRAWLRPRRWSNRWATSCRARRSSGPARRRPWAPGRVEDRRLDGDRGLPRAPLHDGPLDVVAERGDGLERHRFPWVVCTRRLRKLSNCDRRRARPRDHVHQIDVVEDAGDRRPVHDAVRRRGDGLGRDAELARLVLISLILTTRAGSFQSNMLWVSRDPRPACPRAGAPGADLLTFRTAYPVLDRRADRRSDLQVADVDVGSGREPGDRSTSRRSTRSAAGSSSRSARAGPSWGSTAVARVGSDEPGE